MKRTFEFALVVTVVSLGMTIPAFAGSALGSSKQSVTSVTFRPVLCFAPEFKQGQSSGAGASKSKPLPLCGSKYLLSKKNLDVQPSASAAAGFTSRPIPADPKFQSMSNSTKTDLTSAGEVILSGLPGSGTKGRFVLGKAISPEPRVKSAKAVKQVGQWVVQYTFTTKGLQSFESIASRSFHEYIAIVANGVVYSAPLIEPSNSAFSSFSVQGEVAGNFSKHEAQTLASLMR